jgi:hypothetical protein
VSHQVDAAMYAVEPSAFDAMGKRSTPNPCSAQLVTRDEPMLPGSDPCHHRIRMHNVTRALQRAGRVTFCTYVVHNVTHTATAGERVTFCRWRAGHAPTLLTQPSLGKEKSPPPHKRS